MYGLFTRTKKGDVVEVADSGQDVQLLCTYKYVPTPTSAFGEMY